MSFTSKEIEILTKSSTDLHFKKTICPEEHSKIQKKETDL